MMPLGNLVIITTDSNFRNEYSVKRLVSTEPKGPLTSLIMDGIGLLAMVYSVLIVLALVAYIAFPVVLISVWIRWARRSHPRGLLPTLALIGFTFGTASALLAICTAS